MLDPPFCWGSVVILLSDSLTKQERNQWHVTNNAHLNSLRDGRGRAVPVLSMVRGGNKKSLDRALMHG